MDEKPVILEKLLKLNLTLPAGVSTWEELEAEDYLARFLRTLSAGSRFGEGWGWSVQPIDDGGQFGWSATCSRDGRAYILHLTTELGPEPLPATGAWTLLLLAEPAAGVAPSWNASVGCGVGLVLGMFTWAVARGHFGDGLALLAGLAVLLVSGLLAPVALAVQSYRRNPSVEHPTDARLMHSLRGGIENFPPFRLSSSDWQDVAV